MAQHTNPGLCDHPSVTFLNIFVMKLKMPSITPKGSRCLLDKQTTLAFGEFYDKSVLIAVTIKIEVERNQWGGFQPNK
jgi:hypothetical protein